MRRLNRLFQKVDPQHNTIPQAVINRLQKLELSPGQPILYEVPPMSWIFIEEGFLMLIKQKDEKWFCIDFYYEGVDIYFHPEFTSDAKDKRYEVCAVERSVIYYLSPNDEDDLREICPDFFHVKMVLSHRTDMRNRRRWVSLRDLPMARIQQIQKHYTILFRAPTYALAEYLGLRSKTLKKKLQTAQQKHQGRGKGPNDQI